MGTPLSLVYGLTHEKKLARPAQPSPLGCARPKGITRLAIVATPLC